MVLRLFCQNCQSYVTFDEGMQSARCPECLEWLHAIQCTQCEHAFVSLGERTQRCPRCGHDVQFAAARLRTFGDARNPETDDVLVVERHPPRPLSATRLGSRSGLDPFLSDRAVPRILVSLFSTLAWASIILGVISTLVLDANLVRTHHSGWLVLLGTVEVIAATVISASFNAFCAYTLSMLLELVDRRREESLT